MKKIVSFIIASSMMFSLSANCFATETNQMVMIDIWNANVDQPSMGNISTDNNEYALYNAEENTLQIATNPVNVSGYQSGIEVMLYDLTGNQDYISVEALSTGTIETGTKNDGTNHTVEYLSSFEITIPDYLTKEGVEYISIKMRVPHTPMDVVVGTGYLDARLRIDWTNVTSTDLDQIEPNTEMSSGSVTSVNLSDNGIKINADTTMLSSDVTLTATSITSGDEYEFAKEVLGSDITNFELFDVSIDLSGNEVSPTGSLEIVFPYSDLSALYRINDTGTKTTLRGTASEDGYSILSRNLGIFAVVDGVKIQETSTGFSDIEGHWAQTNILNAVEKGLFNGTSNTTFSPEDQMTNGMVITVLHRMAGTPAATAQSDVWYAEAMAWGYENEIIGGYTEFNGEANVSREGLATMLYRFVMLDNEMATGADLSVFEDSSTISDWAVDALSWANAMGIVTGKTSTIISPLSEATRAEVATMLCRYIDNIQ